jgi:hypothetical protein
VQFLSRRVIRTLRARDWHFGFGHDFGRIAVLQQTTFIVVPTAMAPFLVLLYDHFAADHVIQDRVRQ